MKSHQAREPDGHIGVSGEIEEDLHRESEDSTPRRCASGLRRHGAEIAIRYQREVVRKSDFFCQPHGYQKAAAFDVFGTGRSPVIQVAKEISRAHDRAGHQLRKERDVQRVI